MADGAGIGYLFVLDANLTHKGTVEIGFGQNGFALDESGRLWTLGVEGTKGLVGTTVSIVDVGTMRATTRPLRGYPAGIASGPQRKMYATLLERDQIVALNAKGEVVDTLDVDNRPWGIDIGRTGTGVVVTNEGAPTAYVIDFRALRVKHEIPLGDTCPDAREVVILRKRAVVVCSALPGVVVLDLEDAKSLGVLTFPNPRRVEQPRNPVLVDVAHPG